MDANQAAEDGLRSRLAASVVMTYIIEGSVLLCASFSFAHKSDPCGETNALHGFVICQLATGCGAANVLISMAETRTRWPRSAGTRAQPPFDTDSPTDHPGSLAQGSVVWNAARSQFSHLLQSLPCSFQVTRHPVALSKTCTTHPIASSSPVTANCTMGSHEANLGFGSSSKLHSVHGEFVQPSCDRNLLSVADPVPPRLARGVQPGEPDWAFPTSMRIPSCVQTRFDPASPGRKQGRERVRQAPLISVLRAC